MDVTIKTPADIYSRNKSSSVKLLERIYRSSRHHQVRQRTHCLILASPGVK
jgi:hypothetical protein